MTLNKPAKDLTETLEQIPGVMVLLPTLGTSGRKNTLVRISLKKLEALLATERRKLIEQIEAELPEKLDNPPETMMRIARFNNGFNEAVDGFKAILKGLK